MDLARGRLTNPITHDSHTIPVWTVDLTKRKRGNLMPALH